MWIDIQVKKEFGAVEMNFLSYSKISLQYTFMYIIASTFIAFFLLFILKLGSSVIHTWKKFRCFV